MRRSSFSRRAVAVAASGVLALGWATPATAAPTLSDPNAQGSLGFCDRSGKQVRSGDLGAAPFVYRAVSTTAAPQGFEKGRTALFVYQPRQQVAPGEWSGKQMTAAATFSSAKHPMAAGTRLDSALVDFTSVYPSQVDGLVQVRMYFTAPNRPQHSLPYPAAVVRVAGDRWTQVGGGRVDCTSGTARSVEEIALPRAILTAPGRSTPGATPTTGATKGASARPGDASSSGRAGAPSVADATDASGSPVADKQAVDDADRGSSTWIVGLLVGALVLAVAAGAVVLRRRRSA